MKILNEKIVDPKKIEKEIGEFLSKKFGGHVKLISPLSMQPETAEAAATGPTANDSKINFDLKPQQLIDYLDQYIVKQDRAKSILATKICTHFNRIRRQQGEDHPGDAMVGRIKNNILMMGPTGVGKTYMVKLIAQKIGVPFVKGDATKFSETGYVGGDVEDLVRDLVREADNNLELAQYGIIYIDEIDKIAGSSSHFGADVSRTGVQRALLKPLEETEVDLKVPHDPIAMMQELEHYRKTGSRDKHSVNTRNILFIMSGAFTGLPDIIGKRIKDQGIGFGARITTSRDRTGILSAVKSEDLITFGFESEFVGRLPVRAVFEHLSAEDLFTILKNPNNPVILGKKMDFAAYDIQIKFQEAVLDLLAQRAFAENTGARGLVSAVEDALLPFESHLPSTTIGRFAVTQAVIENPQKALAQAADDTVLEMDESFDTLIENEKTSIRTYLECHRQKLSAKFHLNLNASRIDIIAEYHSRHITDIAEAVARIKSYCEDVKKIELHFYKNHDINLVLEEDAIDDVVRRIVFRTLKLETYYQELTASFEYGLKLVREKTGRSRFFINRQALADPEAYIALLLQNKSDRSLPKVDR